MLSIADTALHGPPISIPGGNKVPVSVVRLPLRQFRLYNQLVDETDNLLLAHRAFSKELARSK